MPPETDPRRDDPESRTVLGPPEGPATETFTPATGSLGGWLPSRPASAPAPGPVAAVDPLTLGPGGRIGEFVIERILGQGAFGVVYLARQLSLDRQVALKVVSRAGSAASDGEGRSLARLEHDHIVQVYAETIDPTTGAHLLCMQYVAGTTLAAVIRELKRYGPGGWTGADLLAVLDALGLPPALFDPAAMRDRDFLAGADHIEAVCRIGEQLARALEHAHVRGVLHRDVKPANVLVSRYGRPLLADFNLAIRQTDPERSGVVGGTLAYMAPEHLDAFNPDSPTPPEAVEVRSDVYSLAVVLWELSSGSLPFPSASGPVSRDKLSGVLRDLAGHRRTQPPDFPPRDRRLQDALCRGLAPRPDDRYATAGEFADRLAGLREQRAALRAFPPPNPLTRQAWRHPVAALILGALLPHFVGSALQISYNALRIVGSLTPAQKELFPLVVLVYNVLAYPGCLAWLAMRLIRVVRVWRALHRGDPVDDRVVDQARRRALKLPRDAAIVACLGWLPGAVVFPLALHVGAEPVPLLVWWHFAVSFALAGLIAITYSYFLATGIVVRTMYLRFWSDPRSFREKATDELAAVPNRLRTVNVAAGIIPLAAAVTMVLVTPLGFAHESGYDAFRFLTASLILAGMAGYTAVGHLTRRYLEVIDACTGGEPQRLWRRRNGAASSRDVKQ